MYKRTIVVGLNAPNGCLAIMQLNNLLASIAYSGQQEEYDIRVAGPKEMKALSLANGIGASFQETLCSLERLAESMKKNVFEIKNLSSAIEPIDIKRDPFRESDQQKKLRQRYHNKRR